MLVDTSGHILAQATEPYPTYYPHSGWAEQDPGDWYRSACKTIRRCLASSEIPAGDVGAVSVDGPAHNVALLDENFGVIHPTLHWSDLRSVPQTKRLSEAWGETIYTTTLSDPNPSWTLSHLLWLKEQRPNVWRELRHILVTKDYVRYRFTGEYLTDAYDAMGTQLFDVTANGWSPALCELLEFNRDYLPPVKSPSALGGHLTSEAAKDTGLIEGTPVAIGSGDSVVEAFGVGAVRPGQGVVKLGTAANVNLVTARPLAGRQSITYRHVTDPYWFAITATNSGASTLQWFCEAFCSRGAEGERPLERVTHLAKEASPGADGLLFHPYLMGERTPYWDPYLRADFVGIGPHHALPEFARAVLEGGGLLRARVPRGR